MKKETKKAPTIRFRGFTDDWEQRKLGAIFEEYSDKGHPNLSALTIIQGGGTIRRDDSDRNLQYDKKSLANYKKVETGDFIVHLRSFEGGLEKATTSGIISPAYHTFHGEGTDSRFYYCYFRSERFINHDLKPHVYGIRDGRSIDIKGMKTINIPWTKVEEQKAIGNYIDCLDNLITLHQRKLDQLKTLKKYFLQNMFPAKGAKVPRIRFKGFTGDWEQHKLSDLVEKICVGFVGTCEKYYTHVADGIPMYRTGDLSGFALNHTGIKYVTREFHKKNKKSQLKYGDILIARHGDSGKAIVYDRNEEANCLNIVIIRPNSARCDGKFLAQRINTFSVSHKIKKMAAGSTQIVINTTDIEKLILQIPKNLNEQAKIISCFISIDNLITLHQRKLNQLQTMKKFMLQNLFI